MTIIIIILIRLNPLDELTALPQTPTCSWIRGAEGDGGEWEEKKEVEGELEEREIGHPTFANTFANRSPSLTQ